ncbi:chemotaxis protein CheR [Pseudomonas syringae]|nr:chemotaxis protein CheR [Pseudomonas syringae]MBD8575090.1 chemotaxis protein CheR [Pseudomonas syringae]MBD8789470.1 chemotaxis protein CheR [Pseudomonas syringae]MBD8800659.1 chemotaxis protein CheR [Pseudomonas syringae]MBD8812040.1 chemotaxis protein CheR [Pseudomonas syringae]
MSDDARFFAYLKERIGLDVASVGEAIVERALRQRCTASGAADSDAYWLLLQGSPTEQQALIEAVIVPETWFFRYPESFATLGRLAVARLQALAGVRPLRLLSLPCSTGEEPYSIAMALFDAGLNAAQFRIDAMDISPLSIQRARRAIYGKNSFRGTDLSFRERHFMPFAEGWQVAQRVRDSVDFRPGNLLDPALLNQPAYDFVFCRNLVIYFDRATQQHVFAVLKRLTLEDGVLFIGPAEGNLMNHIGMRSINVAQSFAFRHAREEDAPAVFASPALPASTPAPTAQRVPPPIAPAAPRPFAPGAAARVTAAGPALQGSADQVPSAPFGTLPGPADSDLNAIARLANQGQSREAMAACERYLQQHGPAAPVFYWLGLLSEVDGHMSQAQGYYRKALYLQPQHPETLAQLAALLAAQGDSAGAQRLLERAARSAGKQGGSR